MSLSFSPVDRAHNDRYHPILPDARYIPMSIAQLVGDILDRRPLDGD